MLFLLTISTIYIVPEDYGEFNTKMGDFSSNNSLNYLKLYFLRPFKSIAVNFLTILGAYT